MYDPDHSSFTKLFSTYMQVSMGYWMYEEFNGTTANRLKYASYLGEVQDGSNTQETSVTYPGMYYWNVHVCNNNDLTQTCLVVSQWIENAVFILFKLVVLSTSYVTK